MKSEGTGVAVCDRALCSRLCSHTKWSQDRESDRAAFPVSLTSLCARARPEQEEQPLSSPFSPRLPPEAGVETRQGSSSLLLPGRKTEQKPSESQGIRNLSAACGPLPTEPPRGGEKLSSTFPWKSALILLIHWVQPLYLVWVFFISSVTVFSNIKDTVYLLFSWKPLSVSAYTKSCQNKGLKIKAAQGTKNWTKLSSRKYVIYQPHISICSPLHGTVNPDTWGLTSYRKRKAKPVEWTEEKVCKPHSCLKWSSSCFRLL